MAARRMKKKNKKVAIRPKKKFAKAIHSLRRMNARKQRESVSRASPEFIKDLTSTLRKIRKRGDLVPKKHHKTLSRHKHVLRKLVHPKTSIAQKRKLLTQTKSKGKGQRGGGGQRGGVFPLLIPIIVAAIGGASSVAASAVGAAIMKS